MTKSLELTGRKFGYLIVLGRKESDHLGASVWNCRCECGNEISVRGINLTSRRGATRSCGCMRNNLTGRSFGSLKVISPSPNRGWVCRCSCGNCVTESAGVLMSGRRTSCADCRKAPGKASSDPLPTQQPNGVVPVVSPWVDLPDGSLGRLIGPPEAVSEYISLHPLHQATSASSSETGGTQQCEGSGSVSA